MKRFLVLLTLLILPFAVNAKIPSDKADSMPQGVFKKTRSGDFIQYDTNGKKLHTYKMKNGKIVRIK